MTTAHGIPIHIKPQRRKSLACRLTPRGAVICIPHTLDPASPLVQRFIADAIAKLPAPPPIAQPLTERQLHDLVARWSAKLGVTVVRIQIRTLRNKWGSISTAGILTLATDVLQLPLDLAEYIIVHELLHLRFPNHGKVWQATLGAHLPDWRSHHQQLSNYTPFASQRTPAG